MNITYIKEASTSDKENITAWGLCKNQLGNTNVLSKVNAKCKTPGLERFGTKQSILDPAPNK